MRKFLLILIALFAVGTSYAAGNKVTVFAGTEEEPESKLDIKITSLTPDTKLDPLDKTFWVAMTYDLQMPEELKEDFLDATFYYSVTCDGEEVANGLKNAADINDGAVNFYVDGLTTGKEYKLTVNKIEVYNYSKMDYETFESPLEFYQEGEIASTTFTIYDLDINITGFTPDTKIEQTDGSFKVAMTYDLQMPEELKEDFLDATFYYSVTLNGEEVANGQKNAADINDGFVNFYIDGLSAGKEYKLTVNKIEVYNYSKMDYETFESPLEFYQEGEIASTLFTIYNLGISITALTPDTKIDETDGSFKVAMTYDLQMPEELKEDFLDATFYYSVTCDGEEVANGQKNAADINDGFVNFYIDGLSAGKEYKLTVNKIEVYNYSKMDYETFESPLEFYQEGEIASTLFTIYNLGISITALTPDTKIDETDGSFKVAMTYDLKMPEELKEDFLDATFYYSVTCDGEEVANGQKNAADINDGFVNFYIDGLSAGKEYKLTVNKIEVYNYSKMDYETFESPLEFYQEGEIASISFTIADPTAINKVRMDEKQTIYNLNGVRLNKVTKGVNIINGKKFFVK